LQLQIKKAKIKMIRHFTWSEFDQSVQDIAEECKFREFSGIYGVPRGGLCLAVALSHKLKINLISEPIKNSLIVDDVYETGFTLNKFKNIEGAMFFVLFSKIKPIWWNTLNISETKEWIFFPWENTFNIERDRKEYRNKR
jgi:hypoxanthine phosphoribosyltransferase